MNVLDFNAVLVAWGITGSSIPADLNRDGPLTLAECYRRALARNETMLRVEEDVRQARRAKRAGWAALVPRLTLEDTAYRQNASGKTSESTTGARICGSRPFRPSCR